MTNDNCRSLIQNQKQSQDFLGFILSEIYVLFIVHSLCWQNYEMNIELPIFYFHLAFEIMLKLIKSKAHDTDFNFSIEGEGALIKDSGYFFVDRLVSTH